MKTHLQIFKAGAHTDSSGVKHVVTRADLEQIRDAYNEQQYCAPLVVGHPKTDAPAYGWTRSLRVNGDVLECEHKDVDAEFASMVNEGKFRTISVSLYGKDHPHNPTPGKLHLRHVGFLGAQAPAVKGLTPASFADGDGALQFEFSDTERAVSSSMFSTSRLMRRMRDWMIGEKGIEAADEVLPEYEVANLQTQQERLQDQISQAYSDLEQARSELDAFKNANAAHAATLATLQRNQEFAVFSEPLLQSGTLLPVELSDLRVCFDAVRDLASVTNSPEFAEAQAPLDALTRLIKSRPKAIEYAELSAATSEHVVAHEFASPTGYELSDAGAELVAKANRLKAADPNLSFEAAIIKASKGS